MIMVTWIPAHAVAPAYLHSYSRMQVLIGFALLVLTVIAIWWRGRRGG